MAFGPPVVGFAEMLAWRSRFDLWGVGVIVPYGDLTTAVKTLDWIAAQRDERNRRGRLGQERIALWGGYDTYVGNLIDLLLSSAWSKDA